MSRPREDPGAFLSRESGEEARRAAAAGRRSRGKVEPRRAAAVGCCVKCARGGFRTRERVGKPRLAPRLAALTPAVRGPARGLCSEGGPAHRCPEFRKNPRFGPPQAGGEAETGREGMAWSVTPIQRTRFCGV